MSRRITPTTLLLGVVALSLLTLGVVYALVQITRDVSATVTVSLKVPDGIEIYSDANTTQVVNQLNFGDVVVDGFGTIVQPSSVSIWVKNWSASTFRLDLDDDFPDGEVLFAFNGGPPLPLSGQDVVLDPEEVLPGEVSLRFDGAPTEDVHNFTVFFIGEGPILVPTPTPTAPPTEVPPLPSRVIMVFGEEPENLGAWGNPGCTIIPSHFPCQDAVSDPLAFIDSNTFETVPLSGVQGWEQISSNRWRFSLTEGVTFHNGEEWNAEAAARGIDWKSDPNHGHASVSYTGQAEAVVVDDLTVDVVCDNACPIFPTTAFLITFQAPEWYASASDAEKASTTVGFGPYKMIGNGLGWRRGLDVTMEAYDDYLPNALSPNDTRSPTIDEILMIWRGEPFVRAAMVEVGEADWAFDLGLDLSGDVPVFDHGGAAETFVDVFDTIWTPELTKLKVRQALAHATDRDLLVDEFYDGFYECQGTYAPPGTLGVTPRTLAQYEFDPDLARTLWAEANYDSDNEIVINVFAGRFFRNVEVAEAQAQMWRNVGVNATIQNLETAKWLDVARTGCGRAWREFKGEDHADDPNATFCTDIPPGPPSFANPQTYQLNPSLETLDFGRATGRLDCLNAGSKFCDPVNVQPLLAPCNAAAGAARLTCMTELVDIAYDQVIIYTYFNAEIFYGVSADLAWQPRYDRRARVNQWDIN